MGLFLLGLICGLGIALICVMIYVVYKQDEEDDK